MTRSTLSKVFIFAAGSLVGSVVTWQILKTKYEKMVQEEVEAFKESYKETYTRMMENESTEEAATVESDEENDETDPVAEVPIQEALDSNLTIREYAKKLAENGYTNYSTSEKNSPIVRSNKGPYVISPDEFGEKEDDGYDTISLTLYADKVLTDEMGVPIDDIENTVGQSSLFHFGEYEEDSVFVRNDERHVDYEILLDHRNYADVYTIDPRRAEE